MSRVPRLLPVLTLTAAALAAGCGGGNPLSNPPTVENPPGTGGQKLSFAYYQKCVEPILQAQLRVVQNGQESLNSCAGSGCHDNVNGTGGALRLVVRAATVDLADAANTPDVVRNTDIYKNFYSAQASSIPGNASASKLLNKPELKGVLHGGGLIFEDPSALEVRRISYWINRPVPATEDEFSTASDSMFTPPGAASGECNAS